MKKKLLLIFTVCPFFVFSLAFLAGCTEKTDQGSELKRLFKEEKAIRCELQSMKAGISREWDHTVARLEASLPENMPQEEKNNMLRVRNAGLIRMFESFETVDDGVKQMLAETEKKDAAMAERVAVIKKELMKIDSQKMALFEKISHKKGEEALSSYQAIYEEILGQACD